MTGTTQFCSYCGARSAYHAPFCPAFGIPTQAMSSSLFPRDAPLSQSTGNAGLGIEWRVGQVVLEDFVVERLLGEGGMGKVYLLSNRHTRCRFAVKRARASSEDARRQFLTELQVWIDLPAHENLVTCHFFRSVGNEILIFADYVEGGSLKDWIADRKLYTSAASLEVNRLFARLKDWMAKRKDGERHLQPTLAQMLDIAIQFAWGLACLHSWGLVHQDVKPGNVLLVAKGKAGVQAKVSDFGLARTATRKPETRSTGNILASYGGRTPAYCSPEQAIGSPLSQATDVWSWGVSVLEMFAGQVFWLAGEAAAQSLESYLEHDITDPAIPPMPLPLVDLLRRCFQDEPTRRPAMAQVVEELKAVYRQTVGKDYPRPLPRTPPIKQQARTEERLHWAGASWRDPREWLEKAWQVAGRNMVEADVFLAHHQKGWTRQGELVTQIAIYQEAKSLYEQQIQTGCRGLEYELAILCAEKALIHDTAGDISGALQEMEQAIEIYERLATQTSFPQLANDLATAYIYKVNLLVFSGNARAALSLCDRAIEIRERLASQEGEGDSQVMRGLAEAYANKANILWALGDAHASLALYDRGISLLRRQMQQGDDAELAPSLALLCVGKAMALRVLGSSRQAITFYDEAIGVWERLVHQQARRKSAVPLAISYTNKGMALWSLGEAVLAVRSYDQALALLEPLVYQESQQELEKEVARAFVGKAVALRALNETRAALALYDRAIEIYKRLIEQRDYRELTEDLARTYMNKSAAAGALGDSRSAIAICNQAIALFEPLVYEQGRDEAANDLAKVYVNKATALAQQGDFHSALTVCDQAIRLRERLVYRNGRRELLGDLLRAKVLHALILIESGQRAQGVSELRESIKVLRSEATCTDRADLRNILRECESILSQVG